jgi:hypothetical protein
MKYQLVAILIIAILSPILSGQASTQNASNLIVPGQSIGQTHLGRFGGGDLAKLPRPAANDNGMGKYRSVWISKKQKGPNDTLFIYSVANGPRDVQPGSGVSIELIRVTSSWYQTANGTSTGKSLAQIRRSFPKARPTDEKLTVYDDAAQGIAFEFAGDTNSESLCIAIMIHPPGTVNFTTAKDVDEILRTNGIKP